MMKQASQAGDWQRQLDEAAVHLTTHDPRMAAIITAAGPCTLLPQTDHYLRLVSAIISQQLSVKAARTILGRFRDLFDGSVPLPEEILKVSDDELRAIGFSYAKAAYAKDLAQHIIDGRLDLAHLETLPNDEVIRQLTAVKGIGEWSAHMFLMFSLGRLDVLPVGDLGVRRGMMLAYALPALPKPAEMRGVANANGWPPYESIASWYLWRSLED